MEGETRRPLKVTTIAKRRVYNRKGGEKKAPGGDAKKKTESGKWTCMWSEDRRPTGAEGSFQRGKLKKKKQIVGGVGQKWRQLGAE